MWRMGTCHYCGQVCYSERMRHIIIAIAALLVLSGCHTSGYNPLKIERQESWRLVDGVERLLGILTGRVD